MPICVGSRSTSIAASPVRIQPARLLLGAVEILRAQCVSNKSGKVAGAEVAALAARLTARHRATRTDNRSRPDFQSFMSVFCLLSSIP